MLQQRHELGLVGGAAERDRAGHGLARLGAKREDKRVEAVLLAAIESNAPP